MSQSNKQWVPVAPPLPRAQAEILGSLLEANGIPVHLSGTGASQALGMLWGPLGSVEVLVPENHLDKAQALAEAFLSGQVPPESQG